MAGAAPSGHPHGVNTPRPERRLLLLRHANAETTLGVLDHDRELTDRGRRDAHAVGEWLAAQEIAVDLVLCSTAIRTRQTWDAVALAGVPAARVIHLPVIYQGGATGVLQAVVDEAGEAATVVIVGHAPTMPMLADALSAGQGSAQAQAELAAGFPTTGLAVLRYSGEWTDLGPGTAEVETFYIGRG